MSDKIPIIVYAFHTPDSCGGFYWHSDTPENRLQMRDYLLNADFVNKNYSTGVLVALSIVGPPEKITETIEGELQDAIEVGLVGRILARYYQPVSV